jgi:dCTP deaminase
MLLSYNQIVDLLDDGVVTRASYENINAASLDIRLGETLLVERPIHNETNEVFLKRVNLRKKQPLNMVEYSLVREGNFILYPGEFILAQSQEIFHLPNDVSAMYQLKSSMARIGLDHLKAGWCDAGWNGSVLTLELKNCTRHHEIELSYGDLIGQLIFFRHSEVPSHASYATKGRYNGDRSVSGAKHVRSVDISEEEAPNPYEDVHGEVVQVSFALPTRTSIEND